MRFLSMVSNPFGCSASGERLVSAATDGDLQEAKALLECNPRLARYSTFGVRNSPLHCSAAQGHHEIVFLLLESGVDINLRNINGQTALMLACQYGHWEVVQILLLFKANVQRTDYPNGATALHFAALNGHSRCIRLLLADYVPSMPNFWSIIRNKSNQETIEGEFDESALSTIVNKRADGGITALHLAALNGHPETVQLLLDLGASVSVSTMEDGTTLDLIGAGSTPLHYAACSGNEPCCQLLMARGARLTDENANGWTPLMVARSWNRDRLQDILSKEPESHLPVHPSPYLSLPLGSIMEIAREHGYRNCTIEPPSCNEPCAVCLERKCTIASEGCGHEFCIRCALYLCSTYTISSTWSGPPGSIPCPLCRHPMISFVKLPSMSPLKEPPRMSLSLSLCVTGSATSSDTSSTSTTSHSCRPDFQCSRIPPLGSSSFRSLSCQRFPSMKLSPALCMGDPEASPTLVGCTRLGLRRTVSHGERCRGPWLFSFNQCAITTSR